MFLKLLKIFKAKHLNLGKTYFTKEFVASLLESEESVSLEKLSFYKEDYVSLETWINLVKKLGLKEITFS